MKKRQSKNNSQNKLTASVLIFWLFAVISSSQPSVKSFAEGGHNNVFNKGYFSYSILPSWDLKNESFDAGILLSFGGDRENNYGGYSVGYTRRFSLFRQSFAVSGSWLWVPFSSELRETNFCLTLNYSLPHFRVTLGNNYRTYRFSKADIRADDNPSGNYRIIEPGNFIYSFQYRLNREEKPWNLMLSVTNRDFFIIEQETNPVLLLEGTYRFTSNLSSFINIGYKSGGLLCIKVDYFGYLIRLGIKWDILKGQNI